MKTPLFLSRILSHAGDCLVLFVTSIRAAERNPTGDVPDDQVFIRYTSSASGYSLKVPEGWASSEEGPDVNFTDKFDGVAVIVDEAAIPPTMKDVVTRLGKAEKGFKVVIQKRSRSLLVQLYLLSMNLSQRPIQSPISAFASKQAYAFYKNGKIAILILWAPVGADNADHWKLISESFAGRLPVKAETAVIGPPACLISTSNPDGCPEDPGVHRRSRT